MTSAQLRITNGVERGPPVTFRCDGRAVEAHEGESLAAALWASGMRAQTGEQRTEGPPFRVLFCAMGVCQQCVVQVDGMRVEACRVLVRAGLDVRTQS
ncbi:MAG: (2Fe-2S)-binding protein [Casimicrobiaceae bacterium]